MLFRYFISILLIVFSVSSQADDTSREAQRIHEMRGLGYLAAASLMVFYNLDSTPFEPEVIGRYHDSFDRLKRLAQSHNHSPILSELHAIDTLADQLEAIPRNSEYITSVIIPYRRYLLPIFDSFQKIDSELEKLYKEHEHSISDPVRQLHSLSLNHSQVMLQYSMLTFTALSYLNIHDPTLELIDQEIKRKIEILEKADPSLDLGSVKRNYQYLSPKLVEFPRPWVPVRAIFYLNHNIQTLNEAAAGYSP